MHFLRYLVLSFGERQMQLLLYLSYSPSKLNNLFSPVYIHADVIWQGFVLSQA